MTNENDITKYRAIVQKIIDKHLPKWERFSVEAYTEEELYDLASMILEKDEKKREILRENHIIKERFKLSQKLNEIERKQEEYQTLFNTINDLNLLSTSIEMQKNEDIPQNFTYNS